jgi:hypothetical protein
MKISEVKMAFVAITLFGGIVSAQSSNTSASSDRTGNIDGSRMAGNESSNQQFSRRTGKYEGNNNSRNRNSNNILNNGEGAKPGTAGTGTKENSPDARKTYPRNF